MRKWKRGLLIAVCVATVFWLAKTVSDASATTLQPPAIPVKQQNENCLMCHADPDFIGQFGDGEEIPLHVDNEAYLQSVHGPAGLDCVACHTVISDYPHHVEQVTCTTCHDTDGGVDSETYAALEVVLPFADKREMVLEINEACSSCHEEEFDMALDSAHVKAQASGNRDAPVCIDCHGGHDITTPNAPRAKISHTCAKCHKAVYSTYRSSVHGEALEEESNMDVPTCVDCHGVHSVTGPRNTAFHNDSIMLCGDCHSNEEVMGKYDISTAVLDSYLNDFHGRTVDLFRRQGTGISSNKAVCFDCHGIHNIRAPDDPLSTVYPENLQHTCQQCHQDVTIRFPQAWLSHYAPSWEQTPILYAVNLIYKLLIPMTLGGFLAYIGLDVGKRQRDKRGIVKQALAEAEEEYDDFDFE